MPFIIEKVDDLPVENANYRLRHTSEKQLDITFRRRDIRTVLADAGFSSHRIGYVVRLLTASFPIPVKRLSLRRRYSDRDLIEFLRARGFHVYRRNANLPLYEAIRLLEASGYIVEGKIGKKDYASPLASVTGN